MKLISRNNPGRPNTGDPDLPNAYWFIKEFAQYTKEFLPELKLHVHKELFVEWRCKMIYRGDEKYQFSTTLGYDITETETPPKTQDLRDIIITTHTFFKNNMEEFKEEFTMFPSVQNLSEEEIENYTSHLFAILSKI